MGRSGAGFRWLALVVTLLAAGCMSGSTESPPSVVRLPDGIHTVPGTSLIGVPIPEILLNRGFYGRGRPDPSDRQWAAVVKVSGDPRRVYTALAQQAIALGLPPMEPASTACWSPIRSSSRMRNGVYPLSSKDITCSAGSSREDGTKSFAVNLQVCRPCRPQASDAWISYRAVGDPDGGVEQWRELGSPRPTGSGRDARWPPAGTERLARPHPRHCGGGHAELFAVSGNPRDVWSRYYAQLVAAGRLLGAAQAVVDGRKVRQVAIAPSDYSRTVTLIEGRGLERPFLAVESC